MQEFRIDHFTKGWFIGDFTPTLLGTKEFEVAIKHYRKGDKEPLHEHRISTEFTVIVVGTVKMNGNPFSKGSIVRINPYESTDFEALEDTITVVIKVPCAPTDKYLVERS